ncbi:hypothetical protein [Nocardia cyriacigeorgica]|uniref:Uncharacterized protein n=1 Tax=Nocardia cyriacigeorgica (strain GUH-2) TaxID=1127134 RepID=H6RD39_NOCCG|nr:hypothetical protein [Nocardia cyriacigeorgica]BDU05772.1 hypothetical protein FMUBM48_20350 [Nocardia cyriacigeorgica]CCF62683.1 conserved protein of unknown function [Nocardia cyriacigeorgica GUH-2]
MLTVSDEPESGPRDDAEEPTGLRSTRTLRAVFAAVVGVVVVVLVAVGAMQQPRTETVSTDRLGPEQGESVAEYLARARDSLSGTDSAEHWALVSFTEYQSPHRLPELAGGLRIGRVLYQVPLPRVQTQLVTVQVPATEEVVLRSAEDAAWQLLDQLRRATAIDERTEKVITVSAARLREGCACAVGLIVRGTLDQLRDLAARNGIRAVEALPADAVAGAFAVVPLLPDATGVIGPTPDDGPVPDR